MIVTCTFDRYGSQTGLFVGHPAGKPKPVSQSTDATRYADLTPALSVSRLMELTFHGTAWSVIRDQDSPAPAQGAFA